MFKQISSTHLSPEEGSCSLETLPKNKKKFFQIELFIFFNATNWKIVFQNQNEKQ